MPDHFRRRVYTLHFVAASGASVLMERVRSVMAEAQREPAANAPLPVLSSPGASASEAIRA